MDNKYQRLQPLTRARTCKNCLALEIKESRCNLGYCFNEKFQPTESCPNPKTTIEFLKAGKDSLILGKMEPDRPEMLPSCPECGKVRLLRMPDGDVLLGKKCYVLDCGCSQGLPGTKKQVTEEWKEHIQKLQNKS